MMLHASLLKNLSVRALMFKLTLTDYSYNLLQPLIFHMSQITLFEFSF